MIEAVTHTLPGNGILAHPLCNNVAGTGKSHLLVINIALHIFDCSFFRVARLLAHKPGSQRFETLFFCHSGAGAFFRFIRQIDVLKRSAVKGFVNLPFQIFS